MSMVPRAGMAYISKRYEASERECGKSSVIYLMFFYDFQQRFRFTKFHKNYEHVTFDKAVIL